MNPLFQRRPVHHPQAISRLIDDQTLILKLDTGRAGLLNKVGSRVWELMDGRRSLDEIVEMVGQAYDVDRLRIEGDVTAFVQALLERDMLAWAEGEN
jgi:Coenzyme PQQ synthesis protein D (PqqD)